MQNQKKRKQKKKYCYEKNKTAYTILLQVLREADFETNK